MINGKELESININSTCNNEANKREENLSKYINESEENNLSTTENKEKARDGYFCMYEYGKQFFRSTYERACTAKVVSISKTEDLVEE